MTNVESFFEVLKTHRESKNIEVAEICEFTKINSKYIEAIEFGDFTILPNVYMRLFLKAYVNFIGADVDQALKDYELYTTGKISQSKKLTEKEMITDTPKSYNLSSDISSDSQISPKQIYTGILIIASILLFLWWAGKITKEQTENTRVILPQEMTLKESPSVVGVNDTNLNSMPSQELSSSSISQKKYPINLPNQLPLNSDDFLEEKRTSRTTKILELTPPYQISITILKKTKIHLSKIENNEFIDLINQVVSTGKVFIFNFTSTINFEFWSNKHIKLSLNDQSIDNFLKNDDMAVRGSYQGELSQLYLSFYNR